MALAGFLSPLRGYAMKDQRLVIFCPGLQYTVKKQKAIQSSWLEYVESMSKNMEGALDH